MRIVDKIEDILDQERLGLLSGDFNTLEELIGRKTNLIRQWEALGNETTESIERISQKLKRNESLLMSARRGLKSAELQLKQLSNCDTQLTYSKDGRRTSLKNCSHTATKIY